MAGDARRIHCRDEARARLLRLGDVGLLVAQPRHAADHVDGHVFRQGRTERDALDQAAEPFGGEPGRLEHGRQGIVHRHGYEQGLHRGGLRITTPGWHRAGG